MAEQFMSERETVLLEDIRNTVNEMRVANAVTQNDIAYIKEQTTKTNGRVTKNELQIASLENERTKVKAYIAAASAVTGGVIAMGFFVIEKFFI